MYVRQTIRTKHTKHTHTGIHTTATSKHENTQKIHAYEIYMSNPGITQAIVTQKQKRRLGFLNFTTN